MNKKIIWIIIAILVILGVSYTFSSVWKVKTANDVSEVKYDTNTDNSKPYPASESGISGMVTIGPTCPGPVRQEPDPNCADKPYSTTLDLYTADGKFVRAINVGGNGKFTVEVAPGEYQIRQTGSKNLPRMSSQNVTVKENSYTRVNIQFDRGLR